MAYEFKLPDLGEGLTEGEIARWLVSEGQEIAEDDALVEVQTDKTTVEIPSPAAGKVARILVAEGDVVPVVTWVAECDVTAVDLKKLVALALKAAAESLQEFPELNARFEGDAIVYLDRYDLGVAVQTEQGLVVPVVRNCDSASVDELASEVARLADSARAGTLAPEELRGSTFTVTSAGKLAGLFQTPLVNYPEVGILGVHRVAARPVVRDGGVTVRQVGNVSVTFDHRGVDGVRAAA